MANNPDQPNVPDDPFGPPDGADVFVIQCEASPHRELRIWLDDVGAMLRVVDTNTSGRWSGAILTSRYQMAELRDWLTKYLPSQPRRP